MSAKGPTGAGSGQSLGLQGQKGKATKQREKEGRHKTLLVQRCNPFPFKYPQPTQTPNAWWPMASKFSK